MGIAVGVDDDGASGGVVTQPVTARLSNATIGQSRGAIVDRSDAIAHRQRISPT